MRVEIPEEEKNQRRQELLERISAKQTEKVVFNILVSCVQVLHIEDGAECRLFFNGLLYMLGKISLARPKRPEQFFRMLICASNVIHV